MYRCECCGEMLKKALRDCPKCGAEGTISRADAADDGGRGLVETSAGALLLSQVKPRPLSRISTGRAAWDRALGGGFAPPVSVLLGGAEGVGKSTAAAQVAADVARALGGRALYLSAEMPLERLRATALRGGAELGRVLAWSGSSLGRALELVKEHRPRAIVWDSVQRFEADGFAGDHATREVVRRAIQAGARAGAVSVLLSQLNAAGEFEGPRRMRHDVDLVAVLERDESGGMWFRVEKNRDAAAPARELDDGPARAAMH